jgi:hypothetical protein
VDGVQFFPHRFFARASTALIRQQVARAKRHAMRSAACLGRSPSIAETVRGSEHLDRRRFLRPPPTPTKRKRYLTQPEVDRFMKAATELHRACCGPIIAPSCDQSRALTELHPGYKRAASALPNE